MSFGKTVLLMLVGGIFVLGAIIITAVGWNNKEIDLVNLGIAQKQVLEANFDKMWKIIQSNAQVKTEYKEGFKDVYVSIMEGRAMDKGGDFMKWVSESSPQYDASVDKKLMTSIEANRTDFFAEQKKMVSIQKQHKDLIEKWPSKIVVGGRPLIEYTVVSSTKTKAVLESGLEDDIDVFGKKK